MFLSGAPVDDFFRPTLFNYLPVLDALIVSLLWTFGFIIMLNQRLNAEMTEANEQLQIDITQRKQAEAALQESHTKLERIHIIPKRNQVRPRGRGCLSEAF